MRLPPLLDEQRRGLRRDADMHRLARSRRRQRIARAVDLDADQLRAYRHHLRDLAPSKLSLPTGARPCAHNTAPIIIVSYTVRSARKAVLGASFQLSGMRTRYLGRSELPIRYSSTARAHWRPSRIAQTTRDWPRRMSPAANTLDTEVA